MTITQTQTITVDGVDFEATLWFDAEDNTVDIEARAYVQSRYLAYPGSTLVPIDANVYNVPVSEWDAHFEPVARRLMATA